MDMDVGEATQGQVEVTEPAGGTLIRVLLVLLSCRGTVLSLRRRRCSHRSVRLLLDVDHESGQRAVRLPLGSVAPVRMAGLPQRTLLALQERLVQRLDIVVMQIAHQSSDGAVGGSSTTRRGGAGRGRGSRVRGGLCVGYILLLGYALGGLTGGSLLAIFRHG